MLVPLLGGRAHRLAHVVEALPSPAGRLWLTLDDGTVEQVDGNGRITVPPRKPPGPSKILAATDTVVFLGIFADPPGPTVAWNPRSGRTASYGACMRVLAAAKNLILRAPDCAAEYSTLQLADPLRPGGRLITLPSGFVFLERAELSPDGRHLATGLAAAGSGGSDRASLGVLDLATGRWTLTATDSTVRAWSADGTRLFLEDNLSDAPISPLQTWALNDPVVRDMRLPGATRAMPIPAVGTGSPFGLL